MRASQIKDSKSYHFSSSDTNRELGMSKATIIAVSIHALVIFGVTFGSEFDPTKGVTDVATALTQNMTENTEANFVANASQTGGGQVEEQLRLETTQISPLTDNNIQDTQDIINLEQKRRQQRYQESYLNTTISWREIDKESDNKDDKADDNAIEQEARLRREIATLEAQLSQRQQVFAQKTKVETVDSNATTHGKASQYLERFRQHVENVGNASYPPQAKLQGIEGDVMLMVIIKADGNIKAIRLLESSGSRILDDAAKESVRQAAPFGKFTQDMKDIVELRIIRTWSYGDTVEVTY